MKIPTIPITEASRINTLNSLEILDTEEEERFNRLTRIAKKVFNVPVALVSLVDENRQWFKSCLGLDVRQTSRDISFCGHAILESEILVIPDAMLDTRFVDNPLVTGPPHIRFYAGCPITVHNARIGTLCIIDSKPRDIGEDELIVLKDLASLVESEMNALHLSTIDELTKVTNRRGFYNLIRTGLELCSRQNICSTLILIDLNGFKYINDTYGHDEGDQVLKDFSKMMLKSARDADVIGRLGGDEFVAWLSNATMDNAVNYIDRLERVVSEHNKSIKLGYSISFSSGMIEIPPGDASSIEEMIERSDKKMYENKARKKSSA